MMAPAVPGVSKEFSIVAESKGLKSVCIGKHHHSLTFFI